MNTQFLLCIIHFWKKRKSSDQVNGVRFDFALLDLRDFSILPDPETNIPTKSLEDMETLNKNMKKLREDVAEIMKQRCTQKERDGKKEVLLRWREWYDKDEEKKRTSVIVFRWSAWRKKMCPQEGGPYESTLGEEFLKQVSKEITRRNKASDSKL